MTTVVLIHDGFSAEVLVEKLPDLPPQIAYVNYVRVPFEGVEIDIILQVLSNPQLMKKLEDRVMQAYEMQQAGV